MYHHTFEYDIAKMDREVLSIVLQSIKKDLKQQGVKESSIVYHSIIFKGKGSLNNVKPFNSIDHCEIKIDRENGFLKYEISYDSHFLSAVFFLFITIISVFFFWGFLKNIICRPDLFGVIYFTFFNCKKRSQILRRKSNNNN